MTALHRALAAVVLGGLLLTGCSADPTPVPEPKAEESPPPTTPSDCTTDASTLASYDPSAEVVPGGAVERIRNEGKLVVGVSADTYRMGAFDPFKGTIRGFDIEFAQRLAEEIFGAAFEQGKSLQLKVITASNRIPFLQDRKVDLVIRNMTINCTRWEDVAFSGVYYDAVQKVLLREDRAYNERGEQIYSGPEDLAGLYVCAPTGSTSLDNITDVQPEAKIKEASTHTGCLTKLQNGEVDAITGDDTVLAGLAAQDPYAVVPEQEPLSDEPYGIAANEDDVDLIKFVNEVLDQMRADESWQRAYNTWLKPYLGEDKSPPTPTYGRSEP